MIIPVILGPTCSGKTSLALQIAKDLSWDILSIDSRQVFTKLDIGTGKIKEDLNITKNKDYWEVDGVKIWGYDVFDLDFDLNVLSYSKFCRNLILDYKNRGKGLILTCGTGFYLDFLQGNISFTDVDFERKKVLETKSIEELNKILSDIFPGNDLSKVDSKNKRRIITKILSIESGKKSTPFIIEDVVFEIYLLKPERKTLYENADGFVELILKKGVVDEYEKLSKIYPNAKAWDGLIYSEIKHREKDMVQKMKFSMHSYIRRQQTYFNKMKVNFIFDNTSDLKKALVDNVKANFNDTIK